MKISYTLARLFLLCFVMFLLHACSKQGDDNNEYVVKEELFGDHVMFSYDYNDKWQLTKWTYNWEATPDDKRTNITTYFYNTDGRLEHTESVYQGSALDPSRSEYVYNNDGKVALIKNYKVNQGSPVLVGTVDYSYNGQQIVETSSVDNAIIRVVTFTLDDNGNIVKKVTQNPNYAGQTEEFLDYDDKKIISRPPFDGVVTSKNNYRKRISTYMGSKETGYYKYEYNNAGYVTKCIVFGNTSYSVMKFNLVVKK